MKNWNRTVLAALVAAALPAAAQQSQSKQQAAPPPLVTWSGSQAGQEPPPDNMRASRDATTSAPDSRAFDVERFAPAKDAEAFAAKLDAVLASPHRAASSARDVHRHPKETLEFFGLAPGMRVVEITPGAGWYTEILGPLMRGNGTLVVAIWDDTIKGQPRYRYGVLRNFKSMLARRPDLYSEVVIEPFTPPQETSLGEPGSADMVVTFRNVHNWIGDESVDDVFEAAYEVLKPGGVLGVTEHRAAAGRTLKETYESGYLPEDEVVALATKAGFELAAKSEINANPKDTKDHEKGVWTLPPTLALGERDREKYVAIGESDRMTLLFITPLE